MKTLPSCLCILGLTAGTAMGGGIVLMDQIGLDDGSSIDTSNAFANQYFEASFSAYDIGCVDDFDNASGYSASSMQGLVAGWNGYAGLDGVSALTVNFYDSIDAAGTNLDGNVATQTFEGTPAGDPNWTLAGYDLVGVSGDNFWQIGFGMRYTSLIPTNEFGTNGQTAAGWSTIGDGVAWQANPNGGFGFGAYQELAANIAYRILGGTGDECDLPLPAECSADVSGPAGVPDGIVGVDDVLMVIGTFGEVGTGDSRPQGDCYPLPNGNCAVDVDDLLECIGQYGADCQPRGACCFGVDGCTEDQTAGECADAGGDWLGQGSACAACVSGACCLPDASCYAATPEDCNAAGGVYQGDSSLCQDVVCQEAPDNNDCDGAEAIGDGEVNVGNATATTTGPELVDCANGQIYNDLYFSYTATCEGTVTFSTCNQATYDTVIALYDACGGTQLACGDDADGCEGFTSLLEYSMTEGDTVIVRVGSWSDGATGEGLMDISCAVPSEGACCVGEDCYDLLPDDCVLFGGVYQGADTSCADTECGVTNNTCEEAAETECNNGGVPFDTSNAFDSGFGEPDATQCDGTYLDWGASPDVWFYLTISDAGTMDVSLCDAASYDTSLVLYAGSDCGSLAQVACNGDASVETGCQSYYSGIYGYPVNAGDTYYIRIGGWNGASGAGTLTVTCLGAGATGACCLADESCLDDYTSEECDSAGGSWYAEAACADTTCPQVLNCETGNGANPTTIDGAWTAGTSDTGSGYLRAAQCSASGAQSATVYGLALVYSGGWSACADPASEATIAIGTHLADFSETSSATGTYEATTIVYAGVYPLHGWTASNNYAGTVEALSAASTSAGQGECWFLWMSADEGVSYINDGTAWAEETFAVNYCITE